MELLLTVEASSLSGHSHKQTALTYMYLHIPVSGQLQLLTFFLFPDGVRLWEL